MASQSGRQHIERRGTAPTALEPAEAPTRGPGLAPAAEPQVVPSSPTYVGGRFLRRHLGRLLVLALLGAAIGGYVWWRMRPAPAQYTTAAVTRGAVIQSIATTGTVDPVVTVQVGSYVSGIVSQINCHFNTEVKAGQLCAKIDPRPYDLGVEQASANLASARAQLAKDQANVEYARTTYDRDLKLFKQKLVSPDTVDSDKSTYDQAKAQIGLDEATIQQREAALDAARVKLGYTDIDSPVNGIVISRNVDVGQTVAASFQTPTLFLIAKDLTKMQVDTYVSESDVGQARVGQKATFTVEAYPDHVFSGTVTQVRRAPITVQNVVTYDAVISVDNPQLKLLPGMTANTRIITAQRDSVLRVPLQAIRFTPGGFRQMTEAQSQHTTRRPQSSRVWILRDGRPQPVPVSIGLSDNSYAQVTAGELKEGEQVIVKETGTGGGAPPRRGFLS